MSVNKQSTISEIRANALEHSEVLSVSSQLDGDYPQKATRFSGIVRYPEKADFKIRLNPDEWDTNSSDCEERFLDLFQSIVGDKAIYLGYNNGYKDRGMKGEFLVLVGMIPNKTQRKLNSYVQDSSVVEAVYWGTNNVMFLRDFPESSKDLHDDREDTNLICILSHNNDTFDHVSGKGVEQAMIAFEELEQVAPLKLLWVGQVMYFDTYKRTALGIKYIDSTK